MGMPHAQSAYHSGMSLSGSVRLPPWVTSVCVALGLTVACLPRSTPNRPSAKADAPRSLEPLEAPCASSPSGRLRVLHAAPKGPVGNEQQVAVVFDRSLRPLVAGEYPVPKIELEPKVPGRWDWVGTQALVFTPVSRFFPQGTSFRVTLPAGLTALDKTSLDKPFTLRFETQRPIASFPREPWEDQLSSEPEGQRPPLAIDRAVRIRFEVPVASEALRRALRVRSANKELAFELRDVPLRKELEYWIHPAPVWPLASSIVIAVDPSLRGIEGPLPAAEVVISARVIHRAPRFELRCALRGQRCTLGPGIRLYTKNPVDPEALLQAVHVSPEAAVTASQDAIGFEDLRARTRYRVEIQGGLVGRYGGTSEVQQIDFETGDLAPTLDMGLESGSIEPRLLGPISVRTQGLKRLSFAASVLEPTELFGLEFTKEPVESPLDQRHTFRNVTPDREGIYVEQHDLRSLLGSNHPYGALLVGVSSEQHEAESIERLIQATDLGVSTQLSPEGGLVWVTRLSDAVPVERASVSLVAQGQVMALGETDSRGLLVLGPEVGRSFARVAEERHVHAPRLRLPAPLGDLAETTPPPACSDGAEAELPAPLIEGLDSDAPIGLYVRHGSDWTVQPLTRNGLLGSHAIDEYGVSIEDHRKRLIALLADRDPYRPGEVVRIKGVLRVETDSLHRALPNAQVRVSLGGPGGATGGSQIVCTNDWGGFSASFQLPSQGPRGRWHVSASSGEAFGSTDLYVTDYRPTEFSATLAGPEGVVMGTRAAFQLHGQYLSGEPLAGASATSVWDTDISQFAPPGADGAATDARELANFEGYDAPRLVTPPGEIHLDAQGRAELAWNQRATLLGPLELELEATVFDRARQTVSTRATTVIHPGDYYLALELAGAASPGEAVRFGVRSLSPEGARLTDRRVEVALLRSDEQWDRSGRKARLTEQDRCVLVTANQPRSCQLVPPQAGLYMLHARSTDAGGRLVQAADSVYVFERPVPGHAGSWSSWNRHALESVDIRLDRTLYHAGQRARAEIRSPYPRARAMVTLERAKVNWHTERRVGPHSVVEIPIPSEIGRNAWVKVLLLREPGRERATCPENEGQQPIAAYGSARLEIDPEDWRLAVSVRPERDTARPGENVPIEVTVKDRRGHPRRAEVALWAVDEGVLLLRDYRTPDWVPLFTELRSDETQSFESRKALGWILLPPNASARTVLGHGYGTAGGTTMPGRAEFAAAGVRSRGEPTPLFLPHLRTDAQGRVRGELHLSGQLSRYRVMAVAHTLEGEFGSGQAAVRARLPLWVRPAVPRFLRVGDEAEAGVVVYGDVTEPTEVTVRAAAEGLELRDSPTRKLTLTGQKPESVWFRWRATEEGQARLWFDARSPEANDSVEQRISVTYPSARESVALYGETQTARSERLGDLSRLDPRRSKLELYLSDTPLAGLDGSAQDLLDYPYDCSEQLVGRLLAVGGFSALRRLASGAFPPYSQPEVERILGILSRRQHRGGFRFWDDPEEEPSVWLTAYVLSGLEELVRAGTPIPREMVSSARRYLRSEIADEGCGTDGPGARLTVVSFVLAVLSSDREHPIDQAQWAECARTSELPLFAQAHLLYAASSFHKPGSPADPRIASLLQRLENALRLSGNEAYAASDDRYPALSAAPDRTTALVLRALLAHDASHPLVPELVRGLLAMRRGSGWSSTQSTAQALLALEDYERVHRGASAAYVAHAWLGPKRLMEASFGAEQHGPRLLEVPGLSLASDTNLAFEKKGQGTLYYTARLTFAPQELPRAPTAHGFSLEHWVVPMTDPTELPGVMQPCGPVSEFDTRAAVLGEVLVSTPVRRNHVVVDVALPAGFEPIDPGLTTSPRALLDSASGWLAADERTRRLARHYVCPEGHCAALFDSVLEELAHDPHRVRRAPWYHRSLAGLALDYRQEIHDDRVVFFVDVMPPGLHRFTYLARATTPGRYRVPPAEVEEMYQPEVFARTAGAEIRVQGRR
jgi:uncharacterized protein YfaS (alpha-2-macroglobulin family)